MLQVPVSRLFITLRLDRYHPSCLALRCPSARVLRLDRTPRRRSARPSRMSVNPCRAAHPLRLKTSPRFPHQTAYPSRRRAAHTPHPNCPRIPLRKSARTPLRRDAPLLPRAARRVATSTTRVITPMSRVVTTTLTMRARMRRLRSAVRGTNPRDPLALACSTKLLARRDRHSFLLNPALRTRNICTIGRR